MSLKERFEKVLAWHPVVPYIVALLVAFPIITALSIGFYSIAFYENILVEAHGMLFDIVIIGILVTWVNSRAERNRTIQRYQDEIDDFLGWEADEASHRIAGNIRRLSRSGITSIYLGRAYLVHAYLVETDLTGANLTGANMAGASLVGATLCNASLRDANLAGTNLAGANLCGTNMHGTNLRGTNLRDTTLDSKLLADFTYDDTTCWPDGFAPPSSGKKVS